MSCFRLDIWPLLDLVSSSPARRRSPAGRRWRPPRHGVVVPEGRQGDGRSSVAEAQRGTPKVFLRERGTLVRECGGRRTPAGFLSVGRPGLWRGRGEGGGEARRRSFACFCFRTRGKRSSRGGLSRGPGRPVHRPEHSKDPRTKRGHAPARSAGRLREEACVAAAPQTLRPQVTTREGLTCEKLLPQGSGGRQVVTS